MKILQLLGQIFELLRPARKVISLSGDVLPDKLPKRNLVLLKDNSENWSVGFLCPCGCGDTIELLLLPNVMPRWDIKIDRNGRPTLYPSVARVSGCRSHFWLRRGRIKWVSMMG